MAFSFLIDAQLPPALAGWLEERGHAAEHVRDVLTGQAPDSWIATYARQRGSVLLTKDDDFALRHPPTDYRLVWLRCGNMSNRGLRDWLAARWAMVEQRLRAGERFVEVR